MSPTSYQTAPPRVADVRVVDTLRLCRRRAGGGRGRRRRIRLLAGLVGLVTGVGDVTLVGGEVAVAQVGVGLLVVSERLVEQLLHVGRDGRRRRGRGRDGGGRARRLLERRRGLAEDVGERLAKRVLHH